MRKGAPSEELRKLGATMRRLRKQRKLSQEQLAQQIGVATSTVARIERGEGNPCLDTLVAVAGALEVPMARLFDGDAECSPEELGRTLEQHVRALRHARDPRSLALAEAVLERIETYTP